MFASCAPSTMSLDHYEMPLDGVVSEGGDFGYQSIAMDGEDDSDPFDYEPSSFAAPAPSAPASFRAKIDAFKRQASAKIDKLFENSPPRQPSSNNVLEQGVIDLTDPLRLTLDLDKAVDFLDEMRTYAVGNPCVPSMVVRFICRRLQTNQAHVTYLALELLDFLVKNTGSALHGAVASQPMMSLIARVARGNAHLPTVGDKAKDLLEAAKGRISAEVKGKDFAEQGARERKDHESEEARRREQIIFKARELVFTWAEGFEQYEKRFPLFHITYLTLINEGVDFNDVTLRPPAILEAPSDGICLHKTVEHNHFPSVARQCSPEEQSLVAAIDNTMQGDDSLAEACLTEEAHEFANQLVNFKNQQIFEDCGGDAEELAVLHDLTQKCEEKQNEMAGAVEAAIQAGEEGIVMRALAANEALNHALQLQGGIKTIEAAEDSSDDEEESKVLVEGIEDIVEYLEEHKMEEPEAPAEETKAEVDVQKEFLTLDFNRQGDAEEKEEEKEEVIDGSAEEVKAVSEKPTVSEKPESK